MVKNKRRQLIVPRNPRKINLWESASASSTVEKATQILHNIERISLEMEMLPNELPNSSIPVTLLQELCENYLFLYSKCLKEQLLITGNPESNDKIH